LGGDHCSASGQPRRQFEALFAADLAKGKGSRGCALGNAAIDIAADECLLTGVVRAYHGSTAAVMQVGSLFTPENQRGPYVRTVPIMDPYRDKANEARD
jgi:hypothetical protein